MSTVSMRIVPADISTNLKSEENRELFPAPVRPTIPIFSPANVSKVTFFKEYATSSASLAKNQKK